MTHRAGTAIVSRFVAIARVMTFVVKFVQVHMHRLTRRRRHYQNRQQVNEEYLMYITNFHLL